MSTKLEHSPTYGMFEDRNDNVVYVTQSSLAGEACCRVYCDTTDSHHTDAIMKALENVEIPHRGHLEFKLRQSPLHLTVKNAEQLILRLRRFLTDAANEADKADMKEWRENG